MSAALSAESYEKRSEEKQPLGAQLTSGGKLSDRISLRADPRVQLPEDVKEDHITQDSPHARSTLAKDAYASVPTASR